MAKNKLEDLTDYLFMALERLNEDGLSAEQIQQEATRAKAVVDLGEKIIDVAKVHLVGARIKADYLGGDQDELPRLFQTTKLPPLLESKE